ncbi:MAG: polysulfide reductase NrfD [Desulfurococcales archaeon]|nr:polysulfide reductase NrfD [Desulfurococcales archaeon]
MSGLKGGNRVVKLVAAIILLAVMVYGVYRYRNPAEPSPEMAILPWGPTVVGYIFFAILSGGIADSALLHAYIERNPAARALIKKSLYGALAVLIPGIILVFSDILHPEHSLWFYAGFNPLSRIAWNAVLYLLYGGSLVLLIIALIRGNGDLERPIVKLLALATVATSINLEMNLGMAYGINIAVPAWYGVYSGIVFVIAAFALGSAWELLIGHKGPEEGVEGAEGLARSYAWENLFSTISLALIVFWSLLALYSWGLASPLAKHIVAGGMASYFWIGYVLLAFIIPVAGATLYLWRRTDRLMLRASMALLIVGIAVLLLVPFNFGGQYLRLEENVMYRLVGSGIEEELSLGPLLNNYLYGPELLAFIGAFGVWLILDILGEALLPLGPGEKPRRLYIFK